MTPTIVQPDNHVIYTLSEEDMSALDKIKLMSGDGNPEDIASHTMCVMQAASYITRAPQYEGDTVYDPEKPGVGPICVSERICDFMVEWNDSIDSTAWRNRLKKLIRDGIILNTRPVIRREHKINQYKTVVEELPEKNNAAYEVAEITRYEIFRDLPHNATFSQKYAAVCEAAALFKVDTIDQTNGCAVPQPTTSEVSNGEEGAA